MKIIGLMACDPNGLIGYQNALPWHYPEDLAHFRALTQNQILIMGRKTFEGLPEDLRADRYCIVFSKEKKQVATERLFFVDSIEEAFALPSLPQHTMCYMIGGAEMARFFLAKHLLDEFILTRIQKTYAGDTFLTEVLTLDWPGNVIQQSTDFSIYHYINPRSSR